MVRLPRNKKQTYRLNSKAQMWPSGLTLAMTLTLNFHMKFPISQPKVVQLPQNEKQTYWLNSKASNVTIRLDLGHDLDLEFSRSKIEFPISQPKVVRLPQNEKQTYRLNSRPQMWQMGLILTITLTFEFWRSNVTLTFDHTHDLDYGFSWSNFEIAVSQNVGSVGLWGFLWWAPSAKREDHHRVSSGWSSVWHRSNTGLSSTQYEQIPIILGVWPFWLTPFFFRSIQGCRGALKSIKRHYLHFGKNKALKRSYFSDFSCWGIKKVLFWKSKLLE